MSGIENRMRRVCERYREPILYIIFGILTTAISIGTFWLFAEHFNIHELLANIIAWIFAVLFSFITNLIWVFNVRIENVAQLIRQVFLFYGGRLATLAVEEVLLWIFATAIGLPAMAIKVITQIIVILLNYIISKLLVFKK